MLQPLIAQKWIGIQVILNKCFLNNTSRRLRLQSVKTDSSHVGIAAVHVESSKSQSESMRIPLAKTLGLTQDAFMNG